MPAQSLFISDRPTGVMRYEVPSSIVFCLVLLFALVSTAKADSLLETFAKSERRIHEGACDEAYQLLLEARKLAKADSDLYEINQQILLSTIACSAFGNFVQVYGATFEFQLDNASPDQLADIQALQLYYAYLNRAQSEAELQYSAMKTAQQVGKKDFPLRYLVDFVYSETGLFTIDPKVLSEYQSAGSAHAADLERYKAEWFRAQNSKITNLLGLDWGDVAAQTIAISYLETALMTRPLFRAHFQRTIRALLDSNRFEQSLQKLSVSNALQFIDITLTATSLAQRRRNILFNISEKYARKWNENKNKRLLSRTDLHILNIKIAALQGQYFSSRPQEAAVDSVLNIINKNGMGYGIEFLGYVQLAALKDIFSATEIEKILNNLKTSKSWYEAGVNKNSVPYNTQPLIDLYSSIEANLRQDPQSEAIFINKLKSAFPDPNDMTLSLWGEVSLNSSVSPSTRYVSGRRYDLFGDSNYLTNEILISNANSMRPSSVSIALGYGLGQITNNKYASPESSLFRQKVEEINSAYAKLLLIKLQSLDDAQFGTVNKKYLLRVEMLTEQLSSVLLRVFGLEKMYSEKILLMPRLEKLKKILAEDEVLVIHEENGVDRWVQFITQTESQTKYVKFSRTLKGQEGLQRSAISEATLPSLKNNAKLFTMDIDPDGFLGRHRKITVLGDGSLFGVPVNLLWDAENEDWLVSSKEVKNFYNFPHLLSSKVHENSQRKERLVGFANPTYDIVSQTKTDSLENMIRAKLPDLAELTPLPETESELEALAGVHGPSSLKFTKADANYARLSKLDFDNIGLFTLSTHGLLAGELDGLTEAAVALTPFDNHSGFVTASDLFALKGTPKAAFLLTCNSATITDGLDTVEIQAISDAFAAKGTPYVLSSMWAVDSLGTTRMVELISQGLRRGLSYSKAHLDAMRQMIMSERHSHPAIWGAFNSMGDEASAAVSH